MAVTHRRKHYCGQCRKETEHEREVTLPARYQSGDPDYEDRTKCGQCGETYQCQECGAAWDTESGECSDVQDHGYHGTEHPWWQVIADGIPWTDADGNTHWTRGDAVGLAELVESLGYTVEMAPE